MKCASYVAAVVALAVLLSCDDNNISGSDSDTVLISSRNSNIRVGESVALAAKERGAAISNQSLTWQSSDTTIATVDAIGMVTGVGPGSATITATIGDKSGIIQISVSLVPIATISVFLPSDPISMTYPSTLIVVAKDSANRTLTGRQFTYTSSNTAVATVSSAGQVWQDIYAKPYTTGSAVITVGSEGKSGSTIVHVVSPSAVPSITVARADTYVGSSTQMAATLYDAAHHPVPGSSFEWSTSDPNVVAVSATGVMTGVGAGIARVFARSDSVSGSTSARTVIVKQIDGGSFHGCFLDDTGVGYCWGRGSNHENGTFGQQAPLAQPTPTLPHWFTSITTGSSNGCALTIDKWSVLDGNAYCWGSNSRGTLGDGTFYENRPGQTVAGGRDFASITVGHDHTCALTAAGAAYCWGGTNYGPSPTEVTGGPLFVAISAGFSSACGLDASGKAYCWGSNDYGQLGTGDVVSSLTPRPIASSARFKSISSFRFMSCGVTTQNEIECWGKRDNLGEDPLTPLKKSGGVMFKSVVVGANHYCGLDVSGIAYCWGSNSEGQLGNSSTVASMTEPVRVNLSVAGISGFVSLGAGEAHSCGISLSGRPYCWGRGEALGKVPGSNVLEPAALPQPWPSPLP
jgi:alpha-tubulin suppressor-like RCC1 family protein/uncharacterized protein YjdB